MRVDKFVPNRFYSQSRIIRQNKAYNAKCFIVLQLHVSTYEIEIV